MNRVRLRSTMQSLNQRALKLYASEGFVEEGRLRESVHIGGHDNDSNGDGYDSLIVMSMPGREHVP